MSNGAAEFVVWLNCLAMLDQGHDATVIVIVSGTATCFASGSHVCCAPGAGVSSGAIGVIAEFVASGCDCFDVGLVALVLLDVDDVWCALGSWYPAEEFPHVLDPVDVDSHAVMHRVLAVASSGAWVAGLADSCGITWVVVVVVVPW